jgi:hypothetical protein
VRFAAGHGRLPWLPPPTDSQKAGVFPHVKRPISAPGRIRTRDPLLRRQLLCPAELRAPEGNCARQRSRDGYAWIAVCHAFEAVPPRETASRRSRGPPKCQSVPQPAVSHRTRRARPVAQRIGDGRMNQFGIEACQFGADGTARSKQARFPISPSAVTDRDPERFRGALANLYPLAVSEPSSALWPRGTRVRGAPRWRRRRRRKRPA